MIEILYPVWNRKEFTQFSFRFLLENTDWGLVSKLVVYDDGSEDGADEWIHEAMKACPVDHEYRFLGLGSPVAIMNHYLLTADVEIFAKIDNDIVVPPDWLDAMLPLMEYDEKLQLLGMEAGRHPEVRRSQRPYKVANASHIGGVGLMRTWAFTKRTRMSANGRFGFTEWQHEFQPRRGWIIPDLPVCALDRIPFEPWASYSAKYVEKNWQRRWTTYFPDADYWDWWPESAVGEVP